MHDDYKIDNVIWAPAPPPRVACIVDFEMTTVGDPLIDLAWAMIFWPEDGNPIALAAPGSPNGIHPDHCQAPAELVDRYAAATGRDLSRFDWYQVFSAWKLAIVLEGSYATHVRGELPQSGSRDFRTSREATPRPRQEVRPMTDPLFDLTDRFLITGAAVASARPSPRDWPSEAPG